jgi:threonine/homoserine/homoserine lactone efflux protein
LNNILLPFFSGIGMGIILGFGFGTIFFALIQNSIKHGFKKGLDIAIGVVLSDILIVLLILFGSQYLDEVDKYKNLIKYTGGILLIGLGIYQFVPHKPVMDKNGVVIGKSRYLYITKGFFLNFMNPINFIAWLTIQIQLKGVYMYNTIQSFYFFIGSILAIFTIEVLISRLAHQIGKSLSERVIKVINYTAGYIFIILGIVLFFKKI